MTHLDPGVSGEENLQKKWIKNTLVYNLLI